MGWKWRGKPALAPAFDGRSGRKTQKKRPRLTLRAGAALLAVLLLTGCGAGKGGSLPPGLPAGGGSSGGDVSAADGMAPGSESGSGSEPVFGGVPDSPRPAAALTAEERAAYGAVLRGEAALLLSGTAEAGSFETDPVTVDRIPRLFSPYSDEAKIDCFAAADLNQDGAQELVLRSVDVAGDMGGCLVLRLQEGEVYGFLFDWRSFVGLKTDGSFEYSNPTGTEWAVGRVEFGPGRCGYAAPLFSGCFDQAADETAYTVDGRLADEEAYSAASAAQAAKPDAVWYPFDEIGIRQALEA